jgi:hypothetical protein
VHLDPIHQCYICQLAGDPTARGMQNDTAAVSFVRFTGVPPPPAPAPPSGTSCVLQPGIDFYGGDPPASVGKVGAHSPEECCEFCEAKANTFCKAFVFNPTKVFGDGSDRSLKVCDLKKAMSPTPTPDCNNCKVVPNQYRISGLLPPPPTPSLPPPTPPICISADTKPPPGFTRR